MPKRARTAPSSLPPSFNAAYCIAVTSRFPAVSRRPVLSPLAIRCAYPSVARFRLWTSERTATRTVCVSTATHGLQTPPSIVGLQFPHGKRRHCVAAKSAWKPLQPLCEKGVRPTCTATRETRVSATKWHASGSAQLKVEEERSRTQVVFTAMRAHASRRLPGGRCTRIPSSCDQASLWASACRGCTARNST